MSKICVIKGDGIGPEIIDEAIKVLKVVRPDLKYFECLMGGAAIDSVGVPLPQETIDTALNSDAVLFGAIGGAKWDNLERHLRPESGLLALRKALGVFANLRPAFVYEGLEELSTIRAEVVKGVDLLVVRELTGGIYFGQPREKSYDKAYNTMVYSRDEIIRIAKIGFESAMKRRKKLCMVDKANVLETSALWREVCDELAPTYPEVELSYMYVDNAAMQLVKNPKQFDVILTENLFGDILSDEASMVVGSIGLLASASIGGKVGLYEPIHGSAPDIAGQGIANPIATILSAAMMLRFALNDEENATKIENAVKKAISEGYGCADLANAKIKLNTQEMGNLIAKYCECKQ